MEQLLTASQQLKAVEAQELSTSMGNSLPCHKDTSIGGILSAEKMRYYGLSKREQETIIKLAQGLSYKEIADAMFVSEATIKTHVARANTKTNSGSKVEIINKLIEETAKRVVYIVILTQAPRKLIAETTSETMQAGALLSKPIAFCTFNHNGRMV